MRLERFPTKVLQAEWAVVLVAGVPNLTINIICFANRTELRSDIKWANVLRWGNHITDNSLRCYSFNPNLAKRMGCHL